MSKDQVREALASLSKVLEREIASGMNWPKDHACAECVPGGEIVVPGFRCGRHAALSALSAATEEQMSVAAAARLVRETPLAPDTHTGTRQRWVLERAARRLEGREAPVFEDTPPPAPKPDATGGFVARPHLPAGSPVQPPRLVPQSVFTGPPTETDLPAQIEAYREHPLIAKPDATGGEAEDCCLTCGATLQEEQRDYCSPECAPSPDAADGEKGRAPPGELPASDSTEAPSDAERPEEYTPFPAPSRCQHHSVFCVGCESCARVQGAALRAATAELERVRGELEAIENWRCVGPDAPQSDCRSGGADLEEMCTPCAAHELHDRWEKIRAKLEEAEGARILNRNAIRLQKERADAAEAKAKEAERERDKALRERDYDRSVTIPALERRIEEAVAMLKSANMWSERTMNREALRILTPAVTEVEG